MLTEYKLVRQFSLPAETVRHIWLLPRPAVVSCFLLRLAAVHDKQLPAKTACIILSKKQNHTDSLGRMPFLAYRSLRRKQEIASQKHHSVHLLGYVYLLKVVQYFCFGSCLLQARQ